MGQGWEGGWREPRDGVEFQAALRALRERSGLTFRDLERAAERRGEVLPRSTAAEMLRRAAPPAPRVLTAFVLACGDDANLERWLAARARIADHPEPAQAPPPPAALDRVPRQLPHAPATFVGRERELAGLDRLVAEAAGAAGGSLGLLTISGVGGVGKTWLALRWGHRNLDRYPDGQLYVNLRGFDPSAEPVPPAAAIRGFLDALGDDPLALPPEPEAQAARYRSLLAGRRVLIVLDNAAGADQVRPLLPGSGGSTVIVTSRDRLTGLIATEGARPLPLGLLAQDEARRLLTRHLGPDRPAAEPSAVDDILTVCGGLPLALAVVAARAAAHPSLPLRALAAELRDARLGLDAFDGGDTATDVRAVFSWSYRALSPEAARLFRLLGLHPGPDLSLPAAASLAGAPAHRVRPLLADLGRVHLVDQPAPDRYAPHDLLRAYARELVESFDPEADQRAARRRLMQHCLRSAEAANRRLAPHWEPLGLPPAPPGVTVEEPADREAALDWFAAEHPVLLGALDLAVAAGAPAEAWGLARALETYLDYRGHWHDWAATQRIALDAAVRLGDQAREADAHRALGRAYTQMGLLEDGHRHFTRALRRYRELGDDVSQADTRRGLGWVCDQLGRQRDALDHNDRALELYRRAGHRAGQALALNNVGWLHAVLGDHRRALDYCAQAVELNRELGDRHAEAGAWDSLGYAHHHLAEYVEAARCFARALVLVRGFGDRFHETEILNHLGDTQLAAGDLDAARSTRRAAVEIGGQIGHPAVEELRAKLKETEPD
ncbi:tetratricopeptide repeat protein [Streptomyces sp. 8K308]|uniref:ATP-binding protein n=1 Tax=Streptomyces sp. 8K308 TaxID=2530388 RepID=UPI002441C4C3|nr:tetratricopeptide repeat protein [Streptomyces sp. 8K308]